nr:EOG090X0EEI [Triops cancriformis]
MERRPPRNMEGLLKFALAGTAKEDPTGPSQFTAEMSEERRRWLEEALENLSVNVVEKLKQAMEVLSPNQSVDQPDRCPDNMQAALETIIDFADDTDCANDFQKIGGLSILHSCLASPHSIVREKCAELIATLTQNNPYCQRHVLAAEVLSVLLRLVEHDPSKTASFKAMSAISCLCRYFPEAQKELAQLEGHSVLLRVLEKSDERLRSKTAFFLSALLKEDTYLERELASRGLAGQIAQYIKSTQCPLFVRRNSSHNYFLVGMKCLSDARGFPGSSFNDTKGKIMIGMTEKINNAKLSSKLCVRDDSVR